MKCTFVVYRFDPALDKKPRYQEYTIEAEPTDKILDCLNKIIPAATAKFTKPLPMPLPLLETVWPSLFVLGLPWKTWSLSSFILPVSTNWVF